MQDGGSLEALFSVCFIYTNKNSSMGRKTINCFNYPVNIHFHESNDRQYTVLTFDHYKIISRTSCFILDL